jgi:hypothetical protein
MHVTEILSTSLHVLLATGAAAMIGSAQPPPAGDAAAVEELTRRVTAYAEMHRQLEGPVPTVKVSSDPGEIRRAMDALGEKIRKARSSAKRGDVFSPEIAALVKRRIASGCGGDFESVHETAHEEMGPLPRAVVNGKWPGPQMTVMPVNVLCQLPPLPEELEYRFVNRDLVLWDVHADVIVDVLHGALPRARKVGGRLPPTAETAPTL